MPQNNKPHKLLLLSSFVAALAIGFFALNQPDIQDEVIFMIPVTVFAWIIPFLLLGLWALYALTRRFIFSGFLTWIHVLITVSTSVLIIVLLYLVNFSFQTASLFDPESKRVEHIGNFTHFAFVACIFGQLVFLTHVVVGFFRQANQTGRTA